jgi:hypothetical protein
MKVVCIRDTCDDGKRVDGITLGKIYAVKRSIRYFDWNGVVDPSGLNGLNTILITQDDGNTHWYSSPERFFLSLNEYRFRQLDKLDI